MHGLEKSYGSRIEFVRANILLPENEALMEEFGFSATPEFYLVNGDGRIIGAWDDTLTEELLREAFEQALLDDAEP